METSNRSFITAICIALAVCLSALTATTASAAEGVEAQRVGADPRSESRTSLSSPIQGVNQGIPVETNPAVGPRRDDPGDVVAEYELPEDYTEQQGIAWDPENGWIWGANYREPCSLYAIDPDDGEMVVNIDIGQGLQGIFYLEGVLFGGGSTPNPWIIYRFDTEGNALENWNSPINLTGSNIATDGVHLFTCDYRTTTVNVFNLDDMEEVASMNFNEVVEGGRIRTIEWVTAHPDGQLWLSGNNGHMYELFVDEDWNFELVQDFEAIGQTHSGIGHDGENLWIGVWGNNILYVVDDGVAEANWLAYDPAEGEIEADGQQEVTVTIDCHGLIDGDYEADLTFTTNDPDDEEVVVAVVVHVEGAPDITVTWPEEYGYNPDNPEESLVDWNLAFDDVFVGVPYDVTVTVVNTGSADLEVNDIFCENNRFTADPVELVLAHDESADVTLTFQTDADDPGDFVAALVFATNDPDAEEYEVALHAEAMNPPEVRVEPGLIEDDLFVGAVEEYTITVFNDGEAPLRFTVTHEIINEPERDADNRYRGARRLRRASIQPTEVGPPVRSRSLFR